MMATLAFKELMSSYEKGKLILFYMIVSVGICLLKVNNRKPGRGVKYVQS